jgi:hypothetical protein
MNNEPMFEFNGKPFKVFHEYAINCEELDESLRASEFPSFYHSQRDAQLKAQGSLSPEDQRPFCMESAIELGYNFPRNEYVLTCGGRTPQFATGAYIRNHIDSVMTEYKGFFPTGFDGHQDPHETTRLRELGVKRYQKAGES